MHRAILSCALALAGASIAFAAPAQADAQESKERALRDEAHKLRQQAVRKHLAALRMIKLALADERAATEDRAKARAKEEAANKLTADEKKVRAARLRDQAHADEVRANELVAQQLAVHSRYFNDACHKVSLQISAKLEPPRAEALKPAINAAWGDMKKDMLDWVMLNGEIQRLRKEASDVLAQADALDAAGSKQFVPVEPMPVEETLKEPGSYILGTSAVPTFLDGQH
jgi:hypothetical protein